MSKSNEHIEEFLNYYLENESSPDYAVLITGCWGSGKTYFIRQYLEGKGAAGKDVVKTFDWLTGFEKHTVIYVSLFGVKTRKDINKKIERILHPKVNSKKIKYLPDAISLVSNLAGIAVGTTIAATATVATGGSTAPYAFPAAAATGKTFGSFFKKLLNKIIHRKKDDEYFVSDFLEEIKDKRLVIVFDDVERADMRPAELLGYLNEYVEHLHIPCILLADMDKWEEAQNNPDDKITLHNLSSTKEKVIGKEFQIQTSVEDIVNAWLNPQNGCLEISDIVKNAWWENRNLVYEMFLAFDDAINKFSKIEVDLSLQQSEQDSFDKEQMKEYVLKMPNRNYRALKQTIKDFNHLCCHFAPDLGELILSPKSKEIGYLKHFLRYFLIMKYGATIGILDVNTIGENRPAWTGLKLQNHEFPAKKDSLSNWHCFVKVCYSFYTVHEFPMQEWLTLNYFDRDKAFDEIHSSSWFAGRPIYLIGLMCESWWSLSDEQATECYSAIKESLDCGNDENEKLIKDPTLLMKLFGILSLVAKETSMDIEVNQLMNRYLDNHSDAIEFGKIISIDSLVRNYSLEENDKVLLEAFRNRLLTIFNERTNSFAKSESQFYEDLMSEKMDDFNRACKIIQQISLSETDFQWIMVNVEKFVDDFCLLESYKKHEILQIMGHRYLNAPNGYDLNKEKVFLDNLKKACSKRVNEKHEVPLPSILAMKQMIEKIEKIENIKNLFTSEVVNK